MDSSLVSKSGGLSCPPIPSTGFLAFMCLLRGTGGGGMPSSWTNQKNHWWKRPGHLRWILRSPSRIFDTLKTINKYLNLAKLPLMQKIMHGLIWQMFHYIQGFIHPRWCRISSINSIILSQLWGAGWCSRKIHCLYLWCKSLRIFVE